MTVDITGSMVNVRTCCVFCSIFLLHCGQTGDIYVRQYVFSHYSMICLLGDVIFEVKSLVRFFWGGATFLHLCVDRMCELISIVKPS